MSERNRGSQGGETLYREHDSVSVCIHLWRGVTKNYLLSERARTRAKSQTSKLG